MVHEVISAYALIERGLEVVPVRWRATASMPPWPQTYDACAGAGGGQQKESPDRVTHTIGIWWEPEALKGGSPGSVDCQRLSRSR